MGRDAAQFLRLWFVCPVWQGCSWPLLGRAARCARGRRPARRPLRMICLVRPGRSVCRWAAARPSSTTHDLPGSAWSLCAPVGGGPPARSPHASLTARSGRSRGPPWPCRHPPAPRPCPATAHGHRSQAFQFPPAPSTPVGPGVLLVGSARLYLACGTKFAMRGFFLATAVQSSPCMRKTCQKGPFWASRASFIPRMRREGGCWASFVPGVGLCVCPVAVLPPPTGTAAWPFNSLRRPHTNGAASLIGGSTRRLEAQLRPPSTPADANGPPSAHKRPKPGMFH